MSIEIVVNQALDLIGHARKIGNIYEGTPEARTALDFWVQTRDEAFLVLQPSWAKKDDTLLLQKTAPVGYDSGTPWSSIYPPPPWKYEYSYPADCVVPLQVKSAPFMLPEWRPRYAPFREAYDNGILVLLTNEPDAMLVYIANDKDPDHWHADFVSAVIENLAKKMAPLLGKVQNAGNPSDRRSEQSAG